MAWFDSRARDLPWRRSSDPYCIWVSEIMLQQTRVTAVLDYYARFLALFPSVTVLAQAAEPDVLAAWSGLGYYRRARMMHKAAQEVVRDHQGIFPRTAEELRKLPGIGEYTSSAVASIAFGEPVAVVDGNVERVLLRVFPENEKPRPCKLVARTRCQPAGRPAPGRLQPVDDGTGRDGLPAPTSFMPPVPRPALLCHPRRAPGAPTKKDAQPADCLRPTAPQPCGGNAGLASAASFVSLADAGHVGTAGGDDAGQ